MDAHQLKRIATNISADNAIEVWIAGMHIHESLVNRGGNEQTAMIAGMHDGDAVSEARHVLVFAKPLLCTY